MRKLTTSLLFLALTAFALMSACLAMAADNGFNSEIAWSNDLEAAKAQAKQENKPIFLLIHQPWCGACKSLKAQFNTPQAKKIVELSSKFIMVNLEGQAEPKDAAYTPDGGYYPRAMFLDTAGNVRPELVNPDRANSEYKYYYSNPDSVVKGMNAALKALSP